MSKSGNIWWNGWWILLGFMALTSCISDNLLDNPEEGAGYYSSVKTQFAISVPTVGSKQSRMPAGNVQQGDAPKFLGLQDIWMVPFRQALPVDGNQMIYRASLLGLPNTGKTTVPEGLEANVNVYNDVVVPVGTQEFLFYAVAKQQALGLNTGFSQQGRLHSTLQRDMTNSSEIQFNLEPCFFGDMESDNSLWYKQAYRLKSTVNAVFNVLKKFKESDNQARKTLYLNFKRLEAGSAFMIREALMDLYKELLTPEVAGTTVDANVERLKQLIVGNDKDALFVDDVTFEWKESLGSLNEFPCNFYIPIGSVQMEYDQKSDEIVYMNVSQLPSPYAVSILDICYPPVLAYFAHTDIAVRDDLVKDWSGIWTSTQPNFAGWNGNEVTLSTQSLALKNKIQYGVACMEAKFRCTASALPDNGLHQIKVPTGGFPVTGILVSGQPNHVNWNFESQSVNTSDYEQIVFDDMCNVKNTTGIQDPGKPVSEIYVSGITAGYNKELVPNYTLLLKSKVQTPVIVLVELTNTSDQIIHGINDGLIPVGAPFYLLATLTPETNIEIQNGTERIPVDNPSMFIPDVTTEVIFNISSLQHAYLTIPDLRSTQLQVGMYVDLNWTLSHVVKANVGEK